MKPSAALLAITALAALWVLGTAVTVKARDAQIEEARALLSGGDAAGALRIVARIEERTDLPAGELISLLVLRATAHAALHETDALAADARALVAIAPSWQAPAGASETLRAALDEARIAQIQPPAVAVQVHAEPSAVRIVAELNDSSGTARGTRISWRIVGERWHHEHAAEVVVRGHAGTSIDYYVEALGPGSVVIARTGSDVSPEQTRVSSAGTDITGGLGTMTPSADTPTSTWLLAGGAVVAAVVVVLALVFLSKDETRTDLGVPMIEWP